MSTSELAPFARRSAVTAFIGERTWPLVIWTAIVVWSVALFSIVRSDYVNFRLAKFDLGNMVQAVWSTAHGRPLEVSMVTGEQGVRLESHVDPILVLLAPLWFLAPTPLTLAAVQIAAVSLGALPVFWLACRHLGSERNAALLALAYLACPWVAWNALEAFHPVALAIPLFLFAVWFLDGDRLWPFAACAVLAALTGELMGVTIAALGIWYAVARGRRRAGLVIAGTGLGWSLLAIFVVVPVASGGTSAYFGYYESVGGSPAGIVRTLFTDPGAILSALLTANDLRYVVALALPLAGLFLLSPGLAIVGGPQLLANGLSDSSLTTSPGHHYSAAVIPFLFAATVFGLARVSERRRAVLVQLVLGTSLALFFLFGAWPGAPGEIRLAYTDVPPARVAALRAAVALVPDDAPVTATNRVASHLSARRYVYTVPTVGRSEWIVLDASDTYIPWRVAGKDRPELLRGFRHRTESDPLWVKVFERDEVSVYRRASVGEDAG